MSLSFLLRGINPTKIFNDYHNGKFSNKELFIPVTKAKISELTTILAPEYGTSPADAIYTFKDKNNIPVIIATTNHKAYEIYRKNSVQAMGGRCEWCLQDFPHLAIGIPVAVAEKFLAVKEGDKYSNQRTFCFWVEGIFCSFECVLAHIHRFLSLDSTRGNYYDNSESLLKFLHKLQFPQENKLHPHPHPRLLKLNGGSLEVKDYYKTTHTYHKTPNIVLLPAKACYLKSI